MGFFSGAEGHKKRTGRGVQGNRPHRSATAPGTAEPRPSGH